jgi:hypothetical protein
MNPCCDTIFHQITEWFKDCQTTHRACSSTSGSAPQLLIPTRLIQVDGEASQVRLAEVAKNLHKVTYTTLTHCWGMRPLLNTTTKTLHLRLHGVNFNDLPQTFRDAVTITRTLGISYLWIDALCIVQDNREDWQREASNIAEYYKNGALNIVAGTKDATLGLFEPRWEPKFQTVEIQRSPGPFCIGWLGSEAFSDANGTSVEEFPDNWRYLSRAHRRAWTLQEVRLARRNLVFQSNEDSSQYCTRPISAQLYMKCQQQVIWENGRQRKLEDASGIDDFRKWCALVEQYSGYQIAFSIDKLPAISALAREHALKTSDEYLAALWRRDLLAGLLWKTRPTEQGQQSSPSEAYQAPSWSWASVNSSIEYPWLMDESPGAQILGCSTTPTHSDLYSWVSDGHVALRGFTRLFTLPAKEEGHDQKPLDIEELTEKGVLNIRCWLDTADDLENKPLKVVSLLITKRVGLILNSSSMGKGAPINAAGQFKRIGIMVIAKQDVEKWVLSSEQADIVIV